MSSVWILSVQKSEISFKKYSAKKIKKGAVKKTKKR